MPPSSPIRRPARKTHVASRRVRATPLPRVFELRDSGRVRQYLAEHPYIRPALRDLSQALESHFSGMGLALEVLDDPESDHSPMLFATVNAGGLSAKEARRRLREFDRSWSVVNEGRIHDALCVNLEFR